MPLELNELNQLKAELQLTPEQETALSTLETETRAEMEALKIDIAEINQFSEKVDALTLSSVKRLVKEHFPKDNLQFVLVGKAEKIRGIAKKYGEVVEKEIRE